MREIDSKNTSPANMFVMAAFVIIVPSLGVIYNSTLTSRRNGKTNNAYIRVINCILSKNAAGRVQQDIEDCYIRVEKDQKIKLDRYNN